MQDEALSLAFSTYQTGSLFAVGLDGEGQLAVDSTQLSRCMGLWADPGGRTLWSAARDFIYRFDNIIPMGTVWEGFDAVFAPQTSWTTGDLDAHDLALDDRGRLIFANTRYNCLAAASEAHHFVPLWRPPFISNQDAGDRCHLNGIALRDGRVAYASVFCEIDQPQAWREHKLDGGVVLDVRSGEAVCRGLSMPHSPRWWNERLWLLESGTGRFGYVDVSRGCFEPVCFCPGYPRGLAFHRHYALIGLSLPREESGFAGLPLDTELRRRGQDATCGLVVVNLLSGEIELAVQMVGCMQELYDVAVLPGIRRPRWVGLDSEDLHFLLSVGPAERL